MSRRLTLQDISDLRAYERERDQLRSRIIELKRRRRVAIGPLVTVVFENRDTMRFQVQEMARAERMLSDEAIAAELDVYNLLIPEPGQLSATLFLELTNEEELRRWLPQLVGVEQAVQLWLPPEGGGSDAGGTAGGDGTAGGAVDVVRCVPEETHEQSLTRQEVTAAVHYIRFELGVDQVERFDAGPVTLAVDHPAYRHSTVLQDETRRELVSDLRP